MDFIKSKLPKDQTIFFFFLFLPGFSPPFQNQYVCTGMYFTFHLITAGNDRNFIAKTKKTKQDEKELDGFFFGEGLSGCKSSRRTLEKG